jgi:hypothetical protein
VADAMTLDELESHDDPRVRALVRELRAARAVIENLLDEDDLRPVDGCDCCCCDACRNYDAAKEPA